VGTRFSYPYRAHRPDHDAAPKRWRTLNLENEYLRCIILPDLGGHLYTCVTR